ncbi:hypothetical protein QH494_17625 [Sphingomonas sp. AR_OL41]|uniref:hypothetical protein n=1 Tax=Sphingomonas sp. AR_OL41 TaxID=3042729 RepID=UPI00248070FA|nr:hypothetical protein [Sphingomonas sp. AR_OL41]MDH7974011.1 hypothetical protein [Sphingomonas sp. AR_OL41]
MTAIAVARSSLATSLTRYRRSWGLWLLLILGPVSARFMIARDDGSGVQIALGNHLPVMTSAVLGVSLGIVVSTLLLPIGFLYLRANVTRRQPWQIEDVTPASRVAIALGRFGADVAVLFAMLVTLTLAGWLLGWLIVTGPLDIVQLSLTLWLVAAPALMGIAALRILFDAVPVTRRGLGELLYLILWIASLAAPVAVQGLPSRFATNFYDFPGFYRPLVGPVPTAHDNISIGASDRLAPGRVPLDVMAGISAPGYVSSRLAWALMSVIVTVFAGLVYRPHRPRRKASRRGMVARLLAAPPPKPADPNAAPAGRAAFAFGNLAWAEFRLIGWGRPFLLLAACAALAGLAGDYRHIGSPAAALLLIFAMAGHAGRSEASGLLALTRTASQAPLARRVAFVMAGVAWAVLLALPAALLNLSARPLALALATGATTALVASLLALISRSAFAPRLVLLILWYGYLSS